MYPHVSLPFTDLRPYVGIVKEQWSECKPQGGADVILLYSTTFCFSCRLILSPWPTLCSVKPWSAGDLVTHLLHFFSSLSPSFSFTLLLFLSTRALPPPHCAPLFPFILHLQLIPVCHFLTSLTYFCAWLLHHASLPLFPFLHIHFFFYRPLWHLIWAGAEGELNDNIFAVFPVCLASHGGLIWC